MRKISIQISILIGFIITGWWQFGGQILQTRAAADWYVSNSGDDGNPCTTETQPCATIQGVLAKPDFADFDTILTATGSYTGTASPIMTFISDERAKISGGWNADFSAQTGMSTLDGEKLHRVIKIESGGGANFNRFIIQNGQAKGAAGVENWGWFECRECVIRYNADIGDENSEGGGIRNANITLLFNTTIYSNTSSSGAGIFNADGDTIIHNSTISGNSARGHGGGINNLSGDVRIYSSTITNNNDSSGAGGIHNEAPSYFGSVEMKNSILAGNSSSEYAQDCNGTIISLGYNLLGDSENCSFTPTIGDRIDTLASLGLLQDNGGLSPTHELLISSPAINEADPEGCKDYMGSELDTDQRGLPRFQRCDIGSFEFQTYVYHQYLPTVQH